LLTDPDKALADADRLFDVSQGLADQGHAALLNQLQRNGAALAACECGSRHWLPPDSLYQLVAVALRPGDATRPGPTKIVVPITCAACGFTKFYDPGVAAAQPRSGW
jgi:hypothetical protein